MFATQRNLNPTSYINTSRRRRRSKQTVHTLPTSAPSIPKPSSNPRSNSTSPPSLIKTNNIRSQSHLFCNLCHCVELVAQCRQCSIYFCVDCLPNIPLVHPNHPTVPYEPSIEPNPSIETASAEATSTITATQKHRKFHCHNCLQHLHETRLECQDCADANFCSTCSPFHYNAHTLMQKRVLAELTDVEGGISHDTAAEGSIGNDTDEDLNRQSGRRPDGELDDEGSDEGSGEGSDDMSSASNSQALEGDDFDLDYSDASYASQSGEEGSPQPPVPPALMGTFEQLLQEAIMQAAAKAGPKIIRKISTGASHGRRRSNQSQQPLTPSSPTRRKRSSSLLDFDITSGSRDRVRTNRQWTDDDKPRLRRLKRKGWSNEQIAIALNRSPGAVAQQWRNQRVSGLK